MRSGIIKSLLKKTFEQMNAELGQGLSMVREQLMELRRRKEDISRPELATELIRTLRILARSHRRFTDEQKTHVFRTSTSANPICSALTSLYSLS